VNPQLQISVLYHSIFSCKLPPDELRRWQAGPALKLVKKYREPKFTQRKVGDQMVKMEIARKAATVISKVPFVRLIAVTGSLAMNSAEEWADIDLMIVTQKDTLWVARPLVYLMLLLSGIKTRQPKSKEERDLLCLNVWIDEGSLSLPTERRNAYTAHEVMAIVPVFDRGGVFESWLIGNSWAYEYWPNAQKRFERVLNTQNTGILLKMVNRLLFTAQYLYMLPKLSTEIVKLKEAYFHPFDWGINIHTKLKEMGVSSVL
jgi:predicted nucleotidyltransferase